MAHTPHDSCHYCAAPNTSRKTSKKARAPTSSPSPRNWDGHMRFCATREQSGADASQAEEEAERALAQQTSLARLRKRATAAPSGYARALS
ncbi:hypothetical protein BESB_076050 [Besnoitia besnoiti]|uniref:Uncharacterized protein n=1 Tax=Besnoitia besnoiti TaxID=94643 RepID=A0A2A9M4H9_BESBE|nr:hypothetical protein BESB_076050 [Besnoitia besnoiti]PFH33388.1 hypothetical protein BESB_076050 [Besnoitia besnoiti]